MHSTLRHGPVPQLQAGGPAAEARPAAANRTGLPDRLKAGVEALSGVSLDGVKVHYNSPKPAQLDALAFAQGSDIHLGPGQERHLPHEAWHIVQQAQGRVQATEQYKGIPINDQPALEAEAEGMGARAARGPAGANAPQAPRRGAVSASSAPAQLMKGDGIAIVRDTALRTTRSATGKMMFLLKAGVAAEELEGRSPKWVRVSTIRPEESIIGWILAADTEPREEGDEVTISRATAIRAKRSPQGDEIAPLKAGARVKVLAQTNKWIRVELTKPEHPVTGWVLVDDTAAQPRVVGANGAAIESAPRHYARLNRKPFEGEPSSGDVKQGGLGDCWLLAPLAAIADTTEGKKSIKAMIRPHEAAAEFDVRFFLPTGKNNDVSERTVTIDNYFAGAGADQVDFAQPVANKGIWPLIVEKAAAEVEGGYGEIDGGFISRAYMFVTGKRPIGLSFRAQPEKLEDSTEEKTPVDLKDALAQALAENKAVSVSIPPQTDVYDAGILVGSDGEAIMFVPHSGLITSSITITYTTAEGNMSYRGIDGNLTCYTHKPPTIITIARAHYVPATSNANITYKYTGLDGIPGGHVYQLTEIDGDEASLVNPHDTSESTAVSFDDLDEYYDASFYIGDPRLG